MKQLILKKFSNGKVSATFNYVLNDGYDKKLIPQFIEQQKQMISKLFGKGVYVRFGNDEVKGLNIKLQAEFMDIELTDVKRTLEKDFPVSVTIGG